MFICVCVGGLTFCRRVRGPTGMVRTKKDRNFPVGCGCYERRKCLTLNTQLGTIGVRSYVQLFAKLCVLSTIVPSCVIYVKR